MTTDRERFAELLDDLDTTHRAARVWYDDLQTRWTAAKEAAGLRRFRSFEPWQVEALMRPFADERDRCVARIASERHWVETQLDRLALTLEPQPGEEWTAARTVYEQSYATQGWGARSYAKASAEATLDDYRHFGLECRVVEETGKLPAFRAEVKASRLDVEIARRRPALSFRAWLKACLRRGTNPRVFLPGLRHGIEAELGLDHFGNEIQPTRIGS